MAVDITGVQQAVLDYAEGWYLGDAERMSRALHDSFIKRRAVDEGDGFETFNKRDMLNFIAQGIGVNPDCEITIIVDEVSDTIATARCHSCLYVDLVHLGKFEGEWRLVHAFYRHREDG